MSGVRLRCDAEGCNGLYPSSSPPVASGKDLAQFRARRGVALGAEGLQAVADVYLAAHAAGEPVTAAVARAFDVSESTAGKRIMASRAAGLLPARNLNTHRAALRKEAVAAGWYSGSDVDLCPAHHPVTQWLAEKGREIVAEIDRLWPYENDPGYRAQCLAEEAGEVSRAITKRRHASHAPDGKCKGLTVDEWTGELELELAQALGVAIDIAHREDINLVPAVQRCVEILQARESGT